MPGTLDTAAVEFVQDIMRIYDDPEFATVGAKEVLAKYARLLMVRDTLPHALISLQYYTTNPKGKEALTAALKLLAATRGATL